MNLYGQHTKHLFSRFGEIIYTTKIEEFVCPPNISETVAVRIMKVAHRPRIACLDNDKTHFKTNVTVHLTNFFFLNHSANRRWPSAQIAAAICLFTVIRPTPLVSVSWIIWGCHLPEQLFVLYDFLYVSVLAYSYGELNCDRLHILITFIYIITPLFTWTQI